MAHHITARLNPTTTSLWRLVTTIPSQQIPRYTPCPYEFIRCKIQPERVFSGAKHKASSWRNSLKNETIELLECLKE